MYDELIWFLQDENYKENMDIIKRSRNMWLKKKRRIAKNWINLYNQKKLKHSMKWTLFKQKRNKNKFKTST